MFMNKEIYQPHDNLYKPDFSKEIEKLKKRAFSDVQIVNEIAENNDFGAGGYYTERQEIYSIQNPVYLDEEYMAFINVIKFNDKDYYIYYDNNEGFEHAYATYDEAMKEVEDFDYFVENEYSSCHKFHETNEKL